METLGLVFKVLWAPGEAMLLVSKKPRVLVPLILLTLVSLGVGISTFSKIDIGEIALRQAEQSGRADSMTQEQKDQMLRGARIFAPVVMAITALAPVVIVTLATAIYFGIFTIIGREATFKTFYAVTVFAYLPLILRQAVALIQVFTIPPSSLVPEDLGSLSLATFLDPTTVSRAAYAAATVVDITSIWIVILLIIGYKFVVRKSVGPGLRVAGVVGVFLFFSLIAVGLRMLQAR